MNVHRCEPIHVLLAEDSPADVRLTREALKDSKLLVDLAVVSDGVEALAYLSKQAPDEGVGRPDLVLLDLNMPRKGGREVLEVIKADADLARIPVVVLTTSEAECDILKSYDLHANCFVVKPIDLDKFIMVVQSIAEYWFTVVRLPS